MYPLHWLPIALILGRRNDAREMEGEYCDTETFRAECGDSEQIIMRRASYGRMKLGRCIEMGLGHLGCFKDALHILDRRCSGKRVCEIRIPDAELESTRPCLKELKTYLDASFTCQSVESFFVSELYCPSNGWNFSLTSTNPNVYISNVGFFQSLSMLLRSHVSCFSKFFTTPAPFFQNTNHLFSSSIDRNIFAPSLFHSLETSPTSSTRFPEQLPPIYVIATPGQIINVTLIDFAYYKTPSNITSKKLKVHHSYFQNKHHTTKPSMSRPETQARVVMRSKRHEVDSLRNVSYFRDDQPCRKYAYLLDIVTGSTKDLVACQQRISNVFVSKGHQVKLVMDVSDLQLAEGEPRDRFILMFEALGCPDPQFHENLAWFKRKSPYLGVMGCYFDEITWSVTCNDSHWSGFDRACPSATTPTVATTTIPLLQPGVPTFRPPTKFLQGTSIHKNYSRLFEYYVDDSSNRFYEVIHGEERKTSFDLVASVILIIATFILVVLIFLAIRRLKPRGHDTEALEDSPLSSKTKMTSHCQLLTKYDGGHVLLSNHETKSSFCCGVVGSNQLFPVVRVSSSETLNNYNNSAVAHGSMPNGGQKTDHYL